MRIAICLPRFRSHAAGPRSSQTALIEELRRRGHEADSVTVPFKWYPGTRVLTNALLWRMLDLEETRRAPVDLVIATKFPSYAIRHPNKVVWLMHQFRQAYELDGTDFGQFGTAPVDRATRRAVHRSIASRSARPGAFSRSRGTSPGGSARRSGSRPSRAAATAHAGLPVRGLRRFRPFGRSARSSQAGRSATRGGGRRPEL